MIPDALGFFSSGSFAGLSWGLFGTLVGVVPLLVILATLSSVTKRRRHRGNGAAVVCLILMLGAMAVLLMPARARRHVHIPPPISMLPAVQVEVPVPAPTPKTAIAGVRVRHSEAAFDDRGMLIVSIDKGDSAGSVTVTTRTERRLPRILEKFSPKAVWSLITACAIAALMFVGYIALDAGTRGHFTWPLRVLTVLCFGAIITTVVALRHAL